MEKESGQWIMYGVDWNDSECIHTVDEAIEYINEIGFLPLFKNEIPGFSLEERTVPEYWWCENEQRDPWMWRAVIARVYYETPDKTVCISDTELPEGAMVSFLVRKRKRK